MNQNVKTGINMTVKRESGHTHARKRYAKGDTIKDVRPSAARWMARRGIAEPANAKAKEALAGPTATSTQAQSEAPGTTE